MKSVALKVGFVAAGTFRATGPVIADSVKRLRAADEFASRAVRAAHVPPPVSRPLRSVLWLRRQFDHGEFQLAKASELLGVHRVSHRDFNQERAGGSISRLRREDSIRDNAIVGARSILA